MLTFEQMAGRSDDSAPVDCAEAHTTRTFAVPTVDVDASTPESAYLRVADKACFDRFPGAAGGTKEQRDGTVISYGFFRPTKAQVAAGARWVRCEVIAQAGERLLPLPGGEGPEIGADGVAERYRLCVTDRPALVSCADPHTFAYVGSQPSRLGPTWPGDAALRTEADGACRTSGRYVYFWPKRSNWEAGDRTLRCFA